MGLLSGRVGLILRADGALGPVYAIIKVLVVKFFIIYLTCTPPPKLVASICDDDGNDCVGGVLPWQPCCWPEASLQIENAMDKALAKRIAGKGLIFVGRYGTY